MADATTPGRREDEPDEPGSPDGSGLWLVLPWLLVALVAVVETAQDAAGEDGSRVGSLLTPAPALAAIWGRWVHVLAVSVCALAVALLGYFIDPWGMEYHGTILGAIAVIGGASVVASRTRERRQHRLTQVQRVAEAAQLALLPPVPERVGDLRLVGRYVAAESEARIGGDLYEVAVSGRCLRLIIGDVRGKGLPAIRTAGGVLGAFREAAHHEPSVAEVAVRCAESVRRMQGESGDPYSGTMISEELFVTAVIVEIEGPVLKVVSLGHPPPLLLAPDGVRGAGSAEEDALPPLGLTDPAVDEVPVVEARWGPGERLVLYTDGIDEARDATGRFFPLASLLEGLRDVPTGSLPDVVLEAVDRHSGGELQDDAALVVVEWVAPEPEPVPERELEPDLKPDLEPPTSPG